MAPSSSRYPLGGNTPSTSKSNVAMKHRRASTSKDNGVSHEAPDAEIEDFGPPPWRTVLNRRADLGYPDFYPSRPGYHQTEDVLTEEFVKNGFSAKTFVAVGAESFSMHGPIHNHLLNGCLDLLNKLGQEVAEKRDEGMPQIGERAFRIPVRVTYNDTKRLQFLADLANPAVPLYRLMRNPVPHGFKGVELLDNMVSPSLGPGAAAHQRTPSGSNGAPKPPDPIPLDRALWFIRVLGANEISAHRGRAQPAIAPSAVAARSPVAVATPSSTATAIATPALMVSSNDWYTQEFTNMFTSWLRNQLSQLSLPVRGPIKGGVPPPKAGLGVLGDEKARSRWLAKWDYSTKLLRELHTKYMVSTRILCSWLADTLATANLAQVGFIGQLIGEYLTDMARHAWVGRVCVRAACEKLKEIRNSAAASTMIKVEEMLRYTVTALFDANPKVLLSPTTWRQHAATVEQIILPSKDKLASNKNDSDNHKEPLRSASKRKRLLSEMKARSDGLTYMPVATESTTSPRRQQMEDLHKLDAMNGSTDMTHLCKTYFDGASSPLSASLDVARLEEKTFILLNWSMGLFQLGVHRGYAVHTLLIIWEKLYNRHRSKLPGYQGNFDFFPILYKWLDTCEMAKKEENAFAIGITIGELTRQGLFSYGRYIKALISNGHSERSRPSGKPPSHHLPLLAAMPIFVEANDLLTQRKLALCGDDPELGKRLDDWEERLMENFKEEVREYVPEVFGWKRFGRSATFKELVNHQMPSTKALSRYLFLQARFWLAPAAAERLKQQGRRPAMNSSTFVRVVHIFHLCNGYSTIADFLIKALQLSEDEEILCNVIDTVRRAADIWTAMERWPSIIDALLDRNQAQDKKSRHHSGLATLLLELARDKRLSEDEEYEVRASIKKHHKVPVKQSVGWVGASESMSAVQQSISTADVTAATQLAAKLFARHGPFSTWSALWWSNVIQAIQTSETDKSAATISAALAHIEEVDEQTDGTLDNVVESWVDGLSETSIADLLGTKTSSTFCAIILNLAAHRKLRIVPKLLSKLVFPSWSQAATAVIATKGRLSSRSVRVIESTVILAQHLLLDCPPAKSLPPINLRQALVLQTERGKAFNAANVPTLIRHLPFLVVLETNRGTSTKLRSQISTLLQGLAMTPQFKAAAFRHLNVLKDSFLSNEWSKPSLDTALEGGMVDTLKLIMSQGSPSTSKNLHSIASLKSSSRFSAWRYTSIVLGMRVEFKRLAMRIENGDDANEARQTLNQLVHATLDRDATADDTDLLCEAFRGIEAAAAQEIVAVGLERLCALLSQMIAAETQASLEEASKSVDLMLRVLESANMAPSQGVSEPSVLSARHALIDLLSVSLQAIERQLTSEEEQPFIDDVVPPHPGDLLAIIIKLLKFTLGLAVTENTSVTTPRPDFGRLASSFFRVITAVFSSASDKTIMSMSDMLIYIVDSASPASRPSVYTSLMAEAASAAVSEAVANRPSLASALPALSPSRRPMALTNPTLAEDGADSSLALDDRPWELLEQLNPPSKQLSHGEQFLTSKPLRDTASISMSLFEPKMKRDAIPNQTLPSPGKDLGPESDEEHRYEDYASERNLGDGLAGEPLAVKQLATSFFAGPEEATIEDDITITAGSPLHATSPANSISAASIVSRPRRQSTRLASGSGKTTKDPITLDDEDDEDDDDDDSDDLEVIEQPAGKRPRVGSKSVAGKTTRKTTGGKSVSRKVVGGKAPRGMGGKAPRGGRRKSIAD